MRPDGRFLLPVWEAQAVGDSVVVLGSGRLLIWGTCRSIPLGDPDGADVACLQLFDPDKRDWSVVPQVRASAPRSLKPYASPRSSPKLGSLGAEVRLRGCPALPSCRCTRVVKGRIWRDDRG